MPSLRPGEWAGAVLAQGRVLPALRHCPEEQLNLGLSLPGRGGLPGFPRGKVGRVPVALKVDHLPPPSQCQRWVGTISLVLTTACKVESVPHCWVRKLRLREAS